MRTKNAIEALKLEICLPHYLQETLINFAKIGFFREINKIRQVLQIQKAQLGHRKAYMLNNYSK